MRGKLPAAYVERIGTQLGDEAEAFLRSYEQPRTFGLRFNRTKLVGLETITARLETEFGLTPVPWCEDGFYYDEEKRPGRHPYHAAGLYYIQEPSAMSAVQLLRPMPGETVLDLAGAPGGKTTQIAALLQGSGLLIANEIHPGRAKILSENVERCGFANVVVMNETPGRLAARFPAFFDKIMLDAPCSGEGMFRKDPDTIAEWSPAHVEMCASRQLDIVRDAIKMLKPGGLLGYSTCTFAPQENERNIATMLAEEPLLELVAVEQIWPHRERGEGHFIAVMRLLGESGDSPVVVAGSRNNRTKAQPNGRGGAGRTSSSAATEAWRAFEGFAVNHAPGLRLPYVQPLLFGEHLYALPLDTVGRFSSTMLDGLRVVRPGLHVAELKKGRIEPAHALALHMPWHAQDGVQLDADDSEIIAYLRGETLAGFPHANGWTLIRLNGFPIGWGKGSDGQVKNHYPKGLRWLGRSF